MNAMERVRRAIHFRGPDRIPQHLYDGGPNDVCIIWPPGPPPLQDWVNEGDQDRLIDAWGSVCYRAAGGVLGFGEVLEPAIKDITRQQDCVFPDLNNPKYVDGVRERIRENTAGDNPQYFVGKMPFGSLFEGLHKIVGLEPLFIAFYEAPEHVHALVSRYAEAQRESIRLLHSVGCHGVLGYDDWGLQERLLVGLDLIEEFFLPHYRQNWALAHELGMDVWLHSCGHIVNVLPKLIDAGLNVIQMDQQENMGLENLGRDFGGKIAFWSPVDIQRTMITGTPDDVRAYVRRMIQTLGSFNGGFISKAYPTPKDVHHSEANTAAMCAAFREFEACV